MLLYIIFYLLTIFPQEEEEEKPDKQEGGDAEKNKKKKAAETACKSFSTVELVPSDKEARKIKPEDSIVAKEMRAKGLVPIKSIVIFMRPDSEYPLCGMPENLLLIYKKLVEDIGNDTQGAINFSLMKGVLGGLIKEPDAEEKEESEGEEGEGEGEEEEE